MSKKRVEIYEDLFPDGRCKYRMPYVDKLTRKHRTVSVTMPARSNSNYKIAKKLLDAKIEVIMTKVQPQNITLGTLTRLYFEDKERTLKKSTYKRNKSSISQLTAWMGEECLLNELTVPYIKSVILEHSPKNSTYNEYLLRFKGMLFWAYMNDYLEDRKLLDKLQYLPDNKKARIQDKYLEKDQLQALLDASRNLPHWNYVIHLMVLSGLRIGEVIALKDADIDDEYIHVRSGYQVTVAEESTPKTESSIRDIYIRDELEILIKEIRKWMREYKFEHGIKSDLFICNSSGSYISYAAFNKYLGELSERTIGKRITTHALRHTAASLLIADGVPLEVVSRMLGHEKSDITKEIYFHITKTLKDRDNAILKNAKVL